MITALLLPLVMLGSPSTPPARAATGDDPAIQIWISNDRRFLPGDRAKVQVRTREDGYLVVFHTDPDGTLRVLFPLDPGDDNFVRSGRKYEIRGRGGRESFTVDDRRGRGTVYAAVSHDPYKFDQFVLGDHWDYRALAPERLPADPEQDLNELVRRMVDNSFDYDVLTYDVLERVVYASGYDQSYYDDYSYSGYSGCGYAYDWCGQPYNYGGGLSIGLFFGRPYYHRHYYDPFYAGYDPFYDPFFYDPYYYRPYYNRPYYYRTWYPGYTYPYRGAFYNHYYGGSWNRGYTPYRFRPADGSLAGYRDRRYTFGRAVNTVYLPPVVRDRQPANSSPLRRTTEAATPTNARPGIERRTPAADVGTGRRTPARSTDRTPVRSSDADRGSDRGQAGAPARDAGRRVENRSASPSIDARRARAPETARPSVPAGRDQEATRNAPTGVRSSETDYAPRRAVERQDNPAGDEPRQIEARPSRPEGEARESGGRNADPAPASRAQPEPRRTEPSNSPPPATRSAPPPSDRGGSRESGSREGGSGGGGYAPAPRSSSPPPDMGGSRGGGGGGSGSGGRRR
jgi:hypothetical protein